MTTLSKLRLASFVLLAASVTGCQPEVGNNASVGSFVSKAHTSTLPSDQSKSGTLLQKPSHTGIPAPVRLNQLQRSNTYYRLMMSDPNHGFRSGFMANHFVMQATKDKGDTWYPIPLPISWAQNIVASGSGQADNPSVHVLDNTSFDVFTTLPKSLVVWSTTNSGGHFRVNRVPLDHAYKMQSISVPSSQDAYVLLTASAKDVEQMTLLHLMDQGKRVRPLPIASLGLSPRTQAVVSFRSEKDGQIVATTPDGRLHLYETHNDGKTWTHRLMQAPDRMRGWKAVHVYQPTQLGAEETFVARYVGTTSGRAAIKTVVYHTVDNGQHYRRTIADSLNQSAADYLGTPARFVNPDHGIAVSDGRMMLTTDAGTTWRTLHVPELEQALHDYPRVLCVDYLAVNSIFVVLQSRDYRNTVSFKSTDSGLTFQKMREM